MIPGGTTNAPLSAIAPRVGAALNAVLWDTGTDSNLSQYSLGSVDIRGMGTATLQIQGTNDDGANWVVIGLINVAGTNAIVGSVSSNNTYLFPMGMRRYRAILTAWTSGNITANPSFNVSGVLPAYAAQLGAGSADIGLFHPIAPVGATGAATKHRLVSAATTNAQNVSAVANKRLIGGAIVNTSAAIKYLKFFNKASAPTVGTDVPVLTISLPVGQTTPLSPLLSDYGSLFAAGLSYAITGAATDLDTTAVAVGDVIVQLEYV